MPRILTCLGPNVPRNLASNTWAPFSKGYFFYTPNGTHICTAVKHFASDRCTVSLNRSGALLSYTWIARVLLCPAWPILMRAENELKTISPMIRFDVQITYIAIVSICYHYVHWTWFSHTYGTDTAVSYWIHPRCWQIHLSHRWQTCCVRSERRWHWLGRSSQHRPPWSDDIWTHIFSSGSRDWGPGTPQLHGLVGGWRGNTESLKYDNEIQSKWLMMISLIICNQKADNSFDQYYDIPVNETYYILHRFPF